MLFKITNSDSDSWPQVVALDVDLPVKQAFHILHEQVAIFFFSQMHDLDNLQGVFMAPLWDFCKGQFVGVLSASDFILILREVFILYFNRGA